ncbi:hypothetical protein [Phyllobacterium endophyticum]|uniref:Uncharacterized protein n=1 Tax=Phyllobacterium endophyticum TaxID=1149773 RepID=A0A2P7AUT8_9HYPH|nr:hypothetical protein [Phyllobacterium endophyticum]MBB3234391.1 hypothetical protein [Phyllobacterium endophyticum]PSH57913.1 hypothetical protein CU100_09490 [Phyllobacterium endophyticum]TYR44120.1 hypothetical protein FY050_02840 [Phyllobacterium endophyticum]
MTSRARKEEFIRSFDGPTINDAIQSALGKHGLSAFHDEVIHDMASSLARDLRDRNRRNRENRRIWAARKTA